MSSSEPLENVQEAIDEAKQAAGAAEDTDLMAESDEIDSGSYSGVDSETDSGTDSGTDAGSDRAEPADDDAEPAEDDPDQAGDESD